MKRKWKILIALAAVLVIIVAGTFIFLNAIVKYGASKGATFALGARTDVGGADIRLFSGSFALNDVTVANPEGFGGGNALEVKKGQIDANVTEVFKDVIPVHLILVDGAVVKLRQHGLKTNLSVLIENASGGKQAKEESKTAAAKKFKIDKITITNAVLEYDVAGLPGARISIPDIELTDISNADGSPVMLGDVIGKILAAIVQQAAAQGGNLPGNIQRALQGVLPAAQKALKGGLGSAGQAVEQIGNIFQQMERERR